MPFDGTQTVPALRLLADTLRDRARWPDGHRWNYLVPRRCALGIADCLGIPSNASDLGMTFLQWYDIFIGLEVYKGRGIFRRRVWMWSISPEHVADAIDSYLAARVLLAAE